MVVWWNLFPGTNVVVAFGGIVERTFGISKRNEYLTNETMARN